ncbi:response regulator [Leptolyngbya sp. AN03gr2]|uniref:response regulator transcription factor n=1 Tax=unclassified Leptolyngbya TaxID=2650499 RepID=UPI003D31523E
MLISLTRPIRVLIADDHPVVRDGLAAILNTQPDLTVVAQVSNGKEVIEEFRQHQPDVAIVDLRMPEMGGVEAIQTICQEFPEACFIMLTIYDGDEDIFRGFRAGAKAYLLKDTPCEEIIEVIHAVCEGQRYYPNHVSEKLAARMDFPGMSEREREVLLLMAEGKTNKEIAAAIGIAESTARFHVSNIMDKLGVNDRTLAVMTALKRGIIRL